MYTFKMVSGRNFHLGLTLERLAPAAKTRRGVQRSGATPDPRRLLRPFACSGCSLIMLADDTHFSW